MLLYFTRYYNIRDSLIYSLLAMYKEMLLTKTLEIKVYMRLNPTQEDVQITKVRHNITVNKFKIQL